MAGHNKTKDSSGIPAEGACMRRIGFGGNVSSAAEGTMRQRLDKANGLLGGILRTDERGGRDWEKTLEERSAAAQGILGSDRELSEKCRFSHISGLIEERLI